MLADRVGEEIRVHCSIVVGHPPIVGHVEAANSGPITKLKAVVRLPVQYVADVVAALHDEVDLERRVQLLVDYFALWELA